MKKILLIAFFTGLLFFGCSETSTNNVVQPVSTSKKELIKVPSRAGLSSELTLSVSKYINGDKGGTIYLVGSYLSISGNYVSFFGSLQIPRNAFDGGKTITMSADPEYAGVDFSPHMVFDIPLDLNLYISGLNVNDLGLTSNNVGFYFVDDSGNLTPVPNSGVSVSKYSGSLNVRDAMLDHFSRYAWAK